MSRARFSDPVRAASAYQNWDVSDREYPPLDGNYTLPIHVETFVRALPTWDQRRQAMARDPLASVDGFRVLVLLVLQHLFGLRVCPQCPDCNLASSPYKPCQDPRGSSATFVGGFLGAWMRRTSPSKPRNLQGRCTPTANVLSNARISTRLCKKFSRWRRKSWRCSETAT